MNEKQIKAHARERANLIVAAFSVTATLIGLTLVGGAMGGWPGAMGGFGGGLAFIGAVGCCVVAFDVEGSDDD